MKAKFILMLLIIALPGVVMAQSDDSLAGGIMSLHKVLDDLYDSLMPLCGKLKDVCAGIAGFGALFYIAYRVWGHLARAEPIDFYPLLRPFVIGFCVLNFSMVLGVINGLMKPTVTGTAALVEDSNKTIATLLKMKDSAVKTTIFWEMYTGPNGEGNREKWYKYTHPKEETPNEGFFESIGNDIRFAFAKASYAFRNAIKEVISEILQLLFAAVSLCVNTLRTFNMVILSILGPLAFGIGVFDGFSHTIRHWLARYINVFLWLPVANIFGTVIATIQIKMLKLDLTQIHQTGDTFFSRTDMGYMIFLIIGIYGYTMVPNIANQIIYVTGGDALTSRVTHDAKAVGNMATAGTYGQFHDRIAGK